MERKPEDNKEKEEKMAYEPPQLIDLAGEIARGQCRDGLAEITTCSAGPNDVL